MGEEVAGVPGAASVEAEAIGAYLSRQRRVRGIGLEELARQTCIPLRSLERLESGAFDDAPDGFVRGFVRTVAEALGLDPDDAVARMLPEVNLADSRARTLELSEAPWRRWAAGAVVVLLALWLWLDRDPAATGEIDPRARPIYRRDAVRDLAREQGLLTAPPRPVSMAPAKTGAGQGAPVEDPAAQP